MIRPTTMARDGMVVTPHYLASQAGLYILQQGGNAVEAALAASAAVAVVYPHANSIGGDNFWLIYNAKDSKVRALNASGRSGKGTTLDYYHSRKFDRIPARGYPAANTVPGAVSGWEEAFNFAAANLAQSGKFKWSELLSAAISYAGNGFPVSKHQADRSLIDFNPEDKSFGNLQRFDETRRIFCNAQGEPLKRGEILMQSDLAKVLEMIAEKGAKVFYSGEIAEKIAADFKANDGPLSFDDFRAHKADWVDPISVGYRAYQAFNLPPNTQGMAALECLNILNNFDLSRIPDGTADFYHLMAETTKVAFANRDRWITDPKFFDIPIEKLLAPKAGRIRPQTPRIWTQSPGAYPLREQRRW